jgi:DNA-binding NarL/FixJ family response regulator
VRPLEHLCGDKRGPLESAVVVGPILIVDSDQSERSEIARLFEDASFDVVSVSTGEEALAAARKTTPCVAILEIALGSLSGYEVCRALRETVGAELPIVFVTGTRTESYDRVAGLLLGADDYIVKPYAADELLTRVRRLVARATSLAPSVPSLPGRLTKRESEILQLLADGLTQKQIAERLFISPRTVGTHIEHILLKLGVRTRAQAVAVAYRGELVDDLSARLPPAS